MVNFRRELYPFVGSNLRLHGTQLHYLDEGEGEPVVMVHGNPTWSFYYRNLVLALRKQYRTIVPDHIGCGLSEKPDDVQYEYTLQTRIDDLESLLEHLDVKEKITLVLHDWGGMIGMGYAARHPERVKRLVLMNTAAFHLPSSKSFPLPLRIVRDTPIGSFLVRHMNVFSAAAATVCCKRKRMTEQVRDGYLSPYDSYSNRIAVLRFVEDIPLQPGDRSYEIVSKVQSSLPQFQKTPTLICWGEKDFVFDRHFREEWERILPTAEVHRFADAGHYVLEDAAEEIIPLVEKFLASHPVNG
jgi:pimeloyl-ACP methyl ester carboxylesterase